MVLLEHLLLIMGKQFHFIGHCGDHGISLDVCRCEGGGVAGVARKHVFCGVFIVHVGKIKCLIFKLLSDL